MRPPILTAMTFLSRIHRQMVAIPYAGACPLLRVRERLLLHLPWQLPWSSFSAPADALVYHGPLARRQGALLLILEAYPATF